MPKAAIFDLDGTLLDSVDLHALAWQEALLKFGYDVSFEQARSSVEARGAPAEAGVVLRRPARSEISSIFLASLGQSKATVDARIII